MNDLAVSQYKRIVIKIGSATVTANHHAHLEHIAQHIKQLRQQGLEVVVVSSGAVATGVATMGKARPKTMPEKQAAAAIGQPQLMRLWAQAMGDTPVSQVLLTADDLQYRNRYLNSKNTLNTLLQWGVVPIINENDTIMVDEIKFGDNDQLSALIATLVEADLLVILSDIEALYDSDPKHNPNAQRVPVVEQVGPDIFAMAGESPNQVGTGGMRSKLLAAQKAQAAGIATLLLPGHVAGSIGQALSGEAIGTLFVASKRLKSHKLWLYQLPQAQGELWLDQGATKALKAHGASLLPSGIVKVVGNFSEGDVVKCLDSLGQHIGTGIVNYSHQDIERIKGAHSQQIESILGFIQSEEVIHRDNFVLQEQP